MSESAGRRPRRLRLLVVCLPLRFFAATSCRLAASNPQRSGRSAGARLTSAPRNICTRGPACRTGWEKKQQNMEETGVHPCPLHACTRACTCTRAHTRTQCTCDERRPGVLSRGSECVRRGSIPAASCFLCAAPWPLAASLEDAAGFSLAQQMACAHARVRACASVSAHICFSGQL